MTELCTRYGISRTTGYKWRERVLALGVRGLEQHSRAPLSSPHTTPLATIDLILAEHTRCGWGARKILKRLRTLDPAHVWPARSTIADILARNDRTRRRRARTHWKHPGAAPLQTTAPNPGWASISKANSARATACAAIRSPLSITLVATCCAAKAFRM